MIIQNNDKKKMIIVNRSLGIINIREVDCSLIRTAVLPPGTVRHEWWAGDVEREKNDGLSTSNGIPNMTIQRRLRYHKHGNTHRYKRCTLVRLRYTVLRLLVSNAISNGAFTPHNVRTHGGVDHSHNQCDYANSVGTYARHKRAKTKRWQTSRWHINSVHVMAHPRRSTTTKTAEQNNDAWKKPVRRNQSTAQHTPIARGETRITRRLVGASTLRVAKCQSPSCDYDDDSDKGRQNLSKSW